MEELSTAYKVSIRPLGSQRSAFRPSIPCKPALTVNCGGSTTRPCSPRGGRLPLPALFSYFSSSTVTFFTHQFFFCHCIPKTVASFFTEASPPPLFLLTRFVYLGVSIYEVSLPRNVFVYSEDSPTPLFWTYITKQHRALTISSDLKSVHTGNRTPRNR